ncbi:MAG: hypothetical protein WC343_04510 [Bacilli bacterium]|jgi:ASC-1-like (ASCH) protein
MAFYIGKEQLLACTAGQVNHDLCSLGVSYEDMEEFIKQLNMNLPNNLFVYIDRLDGRIYYNDSWRRHYEMFKGGYRINYDTVFHQQEKSAIDIQIKIMKNSLKSSLREENIDPIDEEQNPIDVAIENFKNYYGERYGVENLLKQDRDKHSCNSKIIKKSNIVCAIK